MCVLFMGCCVAKGSEWSLLPHCECFRDRGSGQAMSWMPVLAVALMMSHSRKLVIRPIQHVLCEQQSQSRVSSLLKRLRIDYSHGITESRRGTALIRTIVTLTLGFQRGRERRDNPKLCLRLSDTVRLLFRDFWFLAWQRAHGVKQ